MNQFNQAPSNTSDKAPKTLEGSLDFIKPTAEEIEYNEKFRKALDLMSSGKMDEAIAASMKLREVEKPERTFSEEQEKAFDDMRASIAEGLGYKVISNKGKFLRLEKDGWVIEMKHFMLPSGAGFNSGRISEIEIVKDDNDEKYAIWDNGWGEEGEPKDEEIKKIFKEIIDSLN